MHLTRGSNSNGNNHEFQNVSTYCYCCVQNVYKVVRLRHGSMLKALAMLAPFGVLLAVVLLCAGFVGDSLNRNELLARYGRWSANAKGGELESLGYKEGYRVDVDVPEGTWADAPSFSHWWWAPSKFDTIKSLMLFHENGQPIIPPLSPEIGLDVVLRCMIFYQMLHPWSGFLLGVDSNSGGWFSPRIIHTN